MPPRPSHGARRLLATALALGACTGRFVRPVTAERFAPTPERLARGDYLVNQVSACGFCHTTRDSGSLLDTEGTTRFLGGGNLVTDNGVRFTVPNITPDLTTGIGGWSDDEVARAITDGVRPDGRFLFPVMPYDEYQHLSDEDVRAVVVYLRSAPPVSQPEPRVTPKLGLVAGLMLETLAVQMHRPAAGVVAPGRADRVAWGRYVAFAAACTGCHSMTDRAPIGEGEDGYLGGSVVPVLPGLGAGLVYARNLTPDVETGLGRYTAAQLKASLETGVRLDGRRLAPPMSIVLPHYGGMTGDDLDALVAYLRSVKPARHRVPERRLTKAQADEVGEE